MFPALPCFSHFSDSLKFYPSASLRPQSSCLHFPLSWDYRHTRPCLACLLIGNSASGGLEQQSLLSLPPEQLGLKVCAATTPSPIFDHIKALKHTSVFQISFFFFFSFSHFQLLFLAVLEFEFRTLCPFELCP
jgi:hypothetical protein